MTGLISAAPGDGVLWASVTDRLRDALTEQVADWCSPHDNGLEVSKNPVAPCAHVAVQVTRQFKLLQKYYSSAICAAIAAVSPAVTSHDHEHRIPYRPFPVYTHWPHRRPSPLMNPIQHAVIPKVKSAQIIGLVADPTLDRDSCGSVPFGDRIFWTCRDTQLFHNNGSVKILPLITSTGSWSDYDTDGGPALQNLDYGSDPLHTVVLRQYGKNSIQKAFYPVTDAFCGDPSGGCADGTRFALWPDLPPMVTQSTSYRLTAYTWIRESHIRSDLSEVAANPASTLYRVEYSPKWHGSSQSLPQVTILDQQFWKEGEISFGNYGNVVKDGIAYLYGRADGVTSLAKVPVDQVEDKAAYCYWVNGVWTTEMPTLGQDGINITNANALGQGTYYYSEPWQSFVWIGGGVYPVSDMFITTSPDPTGPWIEPIKFYTGVDGNYFLGAYSIQAHPGLISDGKRNEIFITYTKNDLDSEGINVYAHPLVHVQWE